MNKPDEHNGQDDREVKKLLGNLRRIGAAEDFEQRLAGRIRKERSPSPFRMTVEKFGMPLPAFSYSLATIIVLGIVSYYTLFRSGTIRVNDQSFRSESAKEIASAPRDGYAEEKGGASKKKEDQSEAQPSGSGRFDGQGAPRLTSVEEHLRSAVEMDKPQTTPSAGMESKDNRQDLQSLSRQSQIKNEVSRQEVAEGIAKSRIKEAEAPSPAAQNAPSISQPAAGVHVLSKAAPGKQSVSQQTFSSPATQNMKMPVAESISFSVASPDSIHLRDSLRLDSLRRARADSLKHIRP